MSLLRIDGVASSYGGTPVVHDVSLEVGAGEIVSLMGRNGVGKTTLLKTIMGLVRLSAGSIRFGEHELARKSVDRRPRLGLGYVPQGREIFPYLTVQENLRLGMEAIGRGAAEIPERIFELFPALRSKLPSKGGVLSGGEQQQLAIARALVAEPKLILLDEPTEGIQPSIVHQIEGAIDELRTRDRISFLLVEQSLDFALRVADSFYVMEKGVIVEQGSTRGSDKRSIQRHLAV